MMVLMLAGQTYCQYPKTKVINGDTIVLLLKKQADEINKNFNIQVVKTSKPLTKLDNIKTLKRVSI